MPSLLHKFRKHQEDKELRKRLIEEVERDEKDNFLFLSAGDDFIIKGMHYPDSALSEEDGIPVIYKTTDEKVLIAAFPQTLIEMTLEAMDGLSNDEREETWDRVLQALTNSAVKKMKDGEIHDPY